MTTLKDIKKSWKIHRIYLINIIVVICLFIFWLARTFIESEEANYIDGGFNSDNARLETDSGVYLVNDSVLLKKGERFTIEERQNGVTFLCRIGTKDCYKLAGK